MVVIRVEGNLKAVENFERSILAMWGTGPSSGLEARTRLPDALAHLKVKAGETPFEITSQGYETSLATLTVFVDYTATTVEAFRLKWFGNDGGGGRG